MYLEPNTSTHYTFQRSASLYLQSIQFCQGLYSDATLAAFQNKTSSMCAQCQVSAYLPLKESMTHKYTGAEVTPRAKYLVRTGSNYLTDLVKPMPRFLAYCTVQRWLRCDEKSKTWHEKSIRSSRQGEPASCAEGRGAKMCVLPIETRTGSGDESNWKAIPRHFNS